MAENCGSLKHRRNAIGNVASTRLPWNLVKSVRLPSDMLMTAHSFDDYEFFLSLIVVLDTNKWYHQTETLGQDISITIGAEFD